MMILSSAARLGVVGALAVFAANDAVSMPLLYGGAVIFGAAGAIYLPAISALTQQMTPRDLLQAGNSIIQGALHIANLAGPPAAAFLLATLLQAAAPAAGASAAGQSAYAVLFAIDMASFGVSLWALFAIARIDLRHEKKQSAGGRFGLAAIIEGARFTLADPRRRLFFLVAMVANFGVGGPLAVGLPLLAKYVLPQGVLALGVISAAGAA